MVATFSFACALTGNAVAALIDAIEYYNAPLDHYFVTAFPDEIAKLDNGVFVGWQRTGQSFKVSDISTPLAGGTPVCRFYGSPSSGLDSHFYSASPAECAAVQQKFPDAWLLEASNVFQVYLPNTTTGACPAGSVPIYRAWNGRADSNHRYTTSPAILQSMVARGYVAEGYGSATLPVVMCSPGAVGPVPQCSISANDTNPLVGTLITLQSNCSGSPASYTWSGCSSTTASCNVTSNAPGIFTYSVIATNANGSSAPATIDIAWRASTPQLPPPACTITATSETDPPVVGSTVQLTALCTNNPSSFSWSGCNGTSSSCYVSEGAAGPHTYAVVARNPSGPGTPASITLNWSASTPVAQDFCGNFPSVLRTNVPWATQRAITAGYPDPGFQWNGVWVVRFTVPAGTPASSTSGRLFVAEFGGPPVVRDVTVSRFACDFRGVDVSGTNGPLLDTGGVSANGLLTVSSPAGGAAVLQPGQTYYINVRNRGSDGSISCPAGQRCDAFLDLTLPR